MATDILSNWEGSSRMRVHGLLITKPCICLNYSSSSQDCDGAPPGQKFYVRAQWYPERRRGDSIYEISPRGQSSTSVHFNLILTNRLLMSLKRLQNSLRHLILLHPLMIQDLVCLWYESLAIHTTYWESIPEGIWGEAQVMQYLITKNFPELFTGKVMPKQKRVLTVPWYPFLVTDTFWRTAVKESNICFYQDVVWPFFPRSSKGCLAQFHDMGKPGAWPVLWSDFIRVRPKRRADSHWVPGWM